MNMNEVSKKADTRTAGYPELLPGVERCARCGRTIFYRVTVAGQTFVVHGDKAICAVGSLEL